MALPVPAGRFGVAFDDDTLTWAADFTWLDQEYDNLVASYTIDRGRQDVLDRTDTGRAVVQVNDPDGILDPTNTGGPFFGQIDSGLQAWLGRYNPVTDAWDSRFRGFIDDIAYKFDPSQRVNFLEVSLVDIFDVLNAIEMVPGSFGDTPPASSTGQVWFDTAGMDGRVVQVLSDAGIPSNWYVVFSGNVDLWETVYSPGESPMTVIQEAADAEFPTVSNVYTDRFGRLAVHGRLAKFDPAGVLAGAPADSWDWHHWHAGDGSAVAGSPATFAQIREFAFTRVGRSKLINSALAYPIRTAAHDPIANDEIAGQVYQDLTSIGQRGYASWSAPNLITKSGLLDGSTALVETKRFAEYQVENNKSPRDRVTLITFRSKEPGTTGASENWRLLSKVDISDQVDITIDSPGGGGFSAEEFFVEGIHESCKPLNPDYDDITVSLDLSPAPIDTSMFPFS